MIIQNNNNKSKGTPLKQTTKTTKQQIKGFPLQRKQIEGHPPLIQQIKRHFKRANYGQER